MDTTALNNFLLAAAQQPWGIWYPETRLIFADALDGWGKHAEAQVLRTMECVVADEMDQEGDRYPDLMLTGLEIVPMAYRPAHYQIQLKTTEGENWRVFVEDWAHKGGVFPYRWEPSPNHRPFLHWLRLVLLNEENGGVSYAVTTNYGAWHGTLSLDRAQRRCRRRVLMMFGGQIASCAAAYRWEVKDAIALNEALQTDDSPRWVPFAQAQRERVPQDEWPEITGEMSQLDWME